MTVSALQASAFVERVEAIASDVGRLRRRLHGDDYGLHLVDRLSGHVDLLDAMVWPTAGDLVGAGVAIDRALAQVDARARQLRALTGERQPA